MPLLFTKMPANVIVVFRGFTDIVNMNMIDKQMLYDKTIGHIMPRKNETDSRLLLRILEESNSTESSSASARSALGYVQDNILRDVLLASFILAGFIFLIIAMVLLLKYCFKKLPAVIRKALMSIKGKLMWSAVLRWSTQTYLAMAVGVFTSVRAFSKANLVTKITAPF